MLMLPQGCFFYFFFCISEGYFYFFLWLPNGYCDQLKFPQFNSKRWNILRAGKMEKQWWRMVMESILSWSNNKINSICTKGFWLAAKGLKRSFCSLFIGKVYMPHSFLSIYSHEMSLSLPGVRLCKLRVVLHDEIEMYRSSFEFQLFNNSPYSWQITESLRFISCKMEVGLKRWLSVYW